MPQPRANDPLDQAEQWRTQGAAVALATVVKTWGSSPRPAGSQLALRADGSFVGSVSGGCIEAEVIRAGLEILEGAPPRLLEFGIAHERAWEVGLACGGRVEVFVEPLLDRSSFRTLARARADGRPAVRAVRLPSGEDTVLVGSCSGSLGLAAQDALRSDRASVHEVDGQSWFVHPFNPPLRLIIVGAVHIAQPLASMAALAGYAVTIVDPRAAFATTERFPGVSLDEAWPDEALEAMQPDVRTAVVTLTHDPKLDDPALQVALRSPAFYIGSLGSKRTHAARLARLEKKGYDAASLGRICGPVGLAIGARSPAEIAVSILAQMTEVLRTAA